MKTNMKVTIAAIFLMINITFGVTVYAGAATKSGNLGNSGFNSTITVYYVNSQYCSWSGSIAGRVITGSDTIDMNYGTMMHTYSHRFAGAKKTYSNSKNYIVNQGYAYNSMYYNFTRYLYVETVK